MFWYFVLSVYWVNLGVISKNKALFEEVLIQRRHSSPRLRNGERAPEQISNTELTVYPRNVVCFCLAIFPQSPYLLLFKCFCILAFPSLNILELFLFQEEQQERLLEPSLASQVPECIVEGFIPMTQLCLQLSMNVCLIFSSI